jgi:two-component system, NtrC family, response regulator AtoC
MNRVLVVDDDRSMRRTLMIMLEQIGLDPIGAESGEEGLEKFSHEGFAIVLTDLRMEGMTGIELVTRLRQLDPFIPVVVLTAYGTVQTAVQAMKAGAFDYILKPFDVDAITAVINNALDLRRCRSENLYLREEVQGRTAQDGLLGSSPAMAAVVDLISRIAPTRSSVLLTGETGSGKEVVARTIHRMSPRAAKLFVPLNCAAVPADLIESELFGHVRGAFTGAQSDRPGKFEVADGGTLFLDEIGDMPHSLQSKLLRVLEEGVIERVGSSKRMQVDVRVVSATNKDLEESVRRNSFREDLYYRINVFHVHVPALRERAEDIPVLAAFYLSHFAKETGRPLLALTDAATAVLQSYRWPGNVRELRNLMERAAVLCGGPSIDADFFQTLLPRTPPFRKNADHDSGDPGDEANLPLAVENLERRLILKTLALTDDNKAEASRRLGLSERAFWYKLKKYRL